jgi:hypothetical protein
LNPPGDWKKGVLVNTPTLTWEYTRTFKEKKAKKRDVTRPVVSAIKEDYVYLNKK